jgi:hypothetical protein
MLYDPKAPSPFPTPVQRQKRATRALETPQNLVILYFVCQGKASFLTFKFSKKKFDKTPKLFIKSSKFMNIAMYL